MLLKKTCIFQFIISLWVIILFFTFALFICRNRNAFFASRSTSAGLLMMEPLPLINLPPFKVSGRTGLNFCSRKKIFSKSFRLPQFCENLVVKKVYCNRSHSHTSTHTHSHKHSLELSVSQIHAHSLSLAPSHSISISFSHSLTF